MPCRKVFDRFMDEIGKRRIPRRSDIASRYWRSSRPHIRNCQPGYYRFGALRTDYTLIASQIAPTKSLRTWTDDELRALAKATKRNGARHTWRAPCFDHLRNPVCRRLGYLLPALRACWRTCRTGKTKSAMSAFGPKQTCPSAPHMSAFGGKADMTFCGAHVCC